MKRLLLLLILPLALLGQSCNQAPVEEVKQDTTPEQPLINEEPMNENLTKTFESNPTVLIKTNYGDIKVELFADKSPQTVSNFISLAEQDYYDGTLFHRVIPDFMIQGGDPLTKEFPEKENWGRHGTGGPGYTFEDEINSEQLVKGSFAMANSGPNTNGSQFFIVTAESTPWLDGRHTNFGMVLEGMNVVEQIEGLERDARDHPLTDAIVEDIIIQ